MKQAKKILAMALTVVMLIAAVPPVALAAAEEAAYDILAEYSWKGSFNGGTNWEDPELPNDIAIVRENNVGYYLAKISGVCGRLMCCLKNEEETSSVTAPSSPRSRHQE